MEGIQSQVNTFLNVFTLVQILIICILQGGICHSWKCPQQCELCKKLLPLLFCARRYQKNSIFQNYICLQEIKMLVVTIVTSQYRLWINMMGCSFTNTYYVSQISYC